MSASVDTGVHLRQTTDGFHVRFPSDTTFLRPARLMISRWLGYVDAPAEGWDLIITELLTNAVNASAAASAIELEIGFQDNQIRCCVTNEGSWNHPDLLGAGTDQSDGGHNLPEVQVVPGSNRGRGLRLIAQLTDAAKVQNHEGTTSVIVWRKT